MGSKNAGASNITVVYGLKVGIIVGIIDILKPVLAILIVWNFFGYGVFTYISGFASFIGHVFPFYMKFRGGKGAATCIGFSFMIDYRLGIAVIVSMVVFVILTNYIAIGTLSMNVVMLFYVFVFDFNWINASLVIVMLSISIYKHIENFIRIKEGTELGVRDKLKWS